MNPLTQQDMMYSGVNPGNVNNAEKPSTIKKKITYCLRTYSWGDI